MDNTYDLDWLSRIPCFFNFFKIIMNLSTV